MKILHLNVFLQSFVIWEQTSLQKFESYAMNFTPRSVAMGNAVTKAYKLHVKFESGDLQINMYIKTCTRLMCKCKQCIMVTCKHDCKECTRSWHWSSTGKETFSCLPDTSVGQLKDKIGSKFQVTPWWKLIFHCFLDLCCKIWLALVVSADSRWLFWFATLHKLTRAFLPRCPPPSWCSSAMESCCRLTFWHFGIHCWLHKKIWIWQKLLFQGEDEKTLRQARVCSGSKILASRFVFVIISFNLIPS